MSRGNLTLLTMVSTIGGFLFGYDTGVISGALLFLQQEFQLTPFESELVVSATVFGAIAGAVIGSSANELWGRRKVILSSALLFAFGALGMGLARSVQELVLGRLAVGVGLGLSSMTVPLYIAEVSPPDMRGTLVSLNTLLVTGGQFFATVFAAVLSSSPSGWRYMLGLASLPAMLQFIGFLFLPESPRWLVQHGQHDAAVAALASIRGEKDFQHELRSMEAELTTLSRGGAGIAGLWTAISQFASVRRAVVLGCVLQMLQQFCGINTVMYYGVTIIRLAGFTDSHVAIWLGAVVALSNFLFTFVGIYLVDRMGRRQLTLGSLLGVMVMLLVLGAGFYVAEVQSPPVHGGIDACADFTTCFDCVASTSCGFCPVASLSPPPSVVVDAASSSSTSSSGVCYPGTAAGPAHAACAGGGWSFDACPNTTHAPGYVILAALFVYLACFATGMGPMPWTINAEIYPLSVRSTAISLATAVNWISNLVVSLTFLSLIQATSTYATFWLYGAVATVGFVYLVYHLPETKGLTLEEIDGVFQVRGGVTYEPVATDRTL
ncbi:hypothetical protein H257_10115 [Aphanomyces astaci]|uniref:Hexose transporter 1 n=1 Tax=Aphanomyces astaci TaxID=112090 RepID=W4G7U6_APHAT|nr:hypothetical protein H257_10115 [Aphanomyces astaci]ETV75740.1 hypothetical protein H257_10115 [Aphanomyces astaci]|eukprot:XP_009834871.1 hypothetical protein H257_10115 [Aphanomyces astaci]